jgi:hypothetical protein
MKFQRKSSKKISVMGLLSPVIGTAALLMFLLLRNAPTVSLHFADSPSLSSLSSQNKRQTTSASLLNHPSSSRSKQPVATIGYAISLIKCGDKQSTAAGLTDAALVLRHSVHLTSYRVGASKYDYKMYAIVHRRAAKCSGVLQDAGFEVLIRDPPVTVSDIEGDFLRKKIQREWCCGSDEFVKLYAYKLTDVPIVVHVDMDYIFHRPMDDVFDAMLFDKDSVEGRTARERIPRERPTDPWPDNVQCMMTRDWPQVIPGRKAGHQAGLLIVKPDPSVFDTVVGVIKKGDYREGYGRDNGWGGKGYGAFVGAMAMQGLMAYVYDALLPDAWVELNQCRFNHIGMDVLYRQMPSFRKNHPKAGQCRNDLDYCEDCMVTPVEQIYNVHYNQCRKPWNCIGIGSHSEGADKFSIPEDQVHFDHCMELLRVWHDVRIDLEMKLYELTADETVLQGQSGSYKRDVFQGHCKGNGGNQYITLQGQPETFKRIPYLYESRG